MPVSQSIVLESSKLHDLRTSDVARVIRRSRPPVPPSIVCINLHEAIHSQVYVSTFAPFGASGEFIFEILRSLSVACVNVSPETVFFDGPRAEGSTVR